VGDPDTAIFNDACVLSDYSAVTGFNPAVPSSDQGGDMHDFMKYRRHTGLLDANGKRHKIGCYVWLEPGNVQHLMVAMYLFGAVGVGVQLPASALDQFDKGQPWAVVGGSSNVGGHYVPLVANRNNPVCVTWAKTQEMTVGFYKRCNDESAAMISADYLRAGHTPEGFNVSELVKDIALLM